MPKPLFQVSTVKVNKLNFTMLILFSAWFKFSAFCIHLNMNPSPSEHAELGSFTCWSLLWFWLEGVFF